MVAIKAKTDSIQLPAHETDPDLLLGAWHVSVNAILDIEAPVKAMPRRKHTIPWMNDGVRELQKSRDRIAKNLRKIPTPAETDFEELKAAKRRVKSHIRRAAKEYGRGLLSAKDPKAAWKFIRQTTFTDTGSGDNMLPIDAANNYFADIVQDPKGAELVAIEQCDRADAFVIQPVTVKEVEHYLSITKSSTAAGFDDITDFLIRLLAHEMAPNITAIFNCSIEVGAFPAQWKCANVKAVWKGKGSKQDPANYRPTILPILGRLFEKIVAHQLYDFVELNNAITIDQYGFRRKSSCETALISATNYWMEEIDKGNIVGALLVDMSKAFDSVPHDLLMRELESIGCGNAALQWFQSFLTGRKQRVVNTPEVTPWKDVTRGVPQGSCLSPLLFNIFVRQLPIENPCRTHQFADDVTHSMAARTVQEVVDGLSTSFEYTKAFCDTHGLTINADKTQLILLHAPGKKIEENIVLSVGGVSLKPVKSVKLLGVVIDSGLTFSPHIDAVITKCQGLLGALAKSAPFLPTELLRQGSHFLESQGRSGKVREFESNWKVREFQFCKFHFFYLLY